ncbi:hypothetical protein EDD29_5281 [Actinocorallia herbida]|uniref:Uncharacterized protein n=1 Tax=Actinocorallia herbida TaxID=58109 RepID=A0A3N1D288_9ACTN|nr:hypothetical protein [Actinocorallia herbida]ROO87657.1 hypothetical protein EDD29_5281 [Actinocorallia herbida]
MTSRTSPEPTALVSDLMSTDFGTGADGSAGDGRITVVVGADGAPVGLATPEGSGPAGVVEASLPVRDLLTMTGLLELLRDGAPALVVVSEGRPVGIVPAGTVRAEIRRDAGRRDPRWLAGDYRAYGDPAPTGDIRIRCSCGRTNVFDRFSRKETYLCESGGHDFVPYWAA